MVLRRLGWLWLCVFVLAGLRPGVAEAAPPDRAELPAELKDWAGWVEESEPEPRDCRELDDVTICVWPSYLRLEVTPKGARFVLDVSVFGPMQVELPGDEPQWPQQVEVDERTRAVLREGEAPLVELDEGRHVVTGFIPWRKAPDSLRVPESIGIIDLVVGGVAVPFPLRDGVTLSLEGAMLDEIESEEPEEPEEPAAPAEDVPDSETIEVSRRLVDGVPLQVTTRLDLHIAGKARELVLPDPMLEGSTLLQVTAPVPLTRGEEGQLVLQVRSGTFAIDLVGTLPRSPQTLSPPRHPAPWPEDEVWVWNAASAGSPSMGQVSLSGAQAIEHARTHAPSEWQGGATYRLAPDGGLKFEVIQRGVSETSTNQLVLRRQMRVDLAGTGWTVVDDINGEMNRGNRMNLQHEQGALGSVAVGGAPQVITVTEDGLAGVEVRGPQLDMRAQWRIAGSTSTLPLAAWSEEFDRVELDFTLPRGWDLLYAEGPGSLGPTWFGAWRPLDLILLLGVVVLVGRFIGPVAGVTALLGLGLAYTRNGDGYVMLLALVGVAAGLVIPLRRGQSRGVRLALRVAWAMAAFMIAAWVVWRVPAGVAAVWRDGLSGLAHVRLERELETLAKLTMLLAAVAGGGVVLAAAGARAGSAKGMGRVVTVSVVALLGSGVVVAMLAAASDRGVMSPGSGGTSNVDFAAVGERQQQLARAPEPEAASADEDDFRRHKGEEGRMGKPSSKQKSGLYAMKGPAEEEPPADLPAMSRNADEDVWGGLNGSEVGEAYGVGGLGLVGTGRGGGGTGEGTIGLGNTGLIGKGGGGGSGSGYGRGSGAGFGGKGKRVPRVRQGKAKITGSLDKSIVRRIVRAHINEVRYCYNQGLARDPSLKGRAIVQFVVGASGKVDSAVLSETTLRDPQVGECIAKAVKRWKFPKPEGGGSVTVEYPFNLEAGGGGGGGRSEPPAAPKDRFIAKDVDLPEAEAPAVPQTGEGVPQWSGPSWSMTLDRTVERDESVTLWLVTPVVSRILSVVRALALALLAFVLLRQGWLARPPASAQPASGSPPGGTVGAVVVLLSLLLPARAAAAPPPELLEELAERVNAERPLAPSPECGMLCALVGKLEVAVDGDELSLRAEVHMAGPGVWAMPGSVDTWLPRTVRVDGKPARALAVYGGQLLLHLPEGLHVVELSGAIQGGQLELDLAGAPKHVEVLAADGWTVEGVDDDDLAESLSLSRDAPGGTEPAPTGTEPDELAVAEPVAEQERRSQDMEPWFAVERRIQIGPRWTVNTTVTRLNHGPSPTKVHVPLLDGEKMLEASDKVDDPKATITLRSAGESISWTSVLEQRAAVELAAPEDQPWTETWVVSCAGAWQCTDEGTPATTDRGGTRVFHPWPGEALRLTLLDPSPAEGPLLAVDRAQLELQLGETGTEARLAMTVRTATVGERTLTLPAEAHLGNVKIDGDDVPMAKDATELRLTFQPGLHEVVVEFKTDQSAAAVVRAPVVQLGGRAVNARVTFEYADAGERAVVWTSGEGLGPMVWLWPYIGVLVLLSLAMARFTKPPLNALQWLLLSLGFSVLVVPVVWLWFVLVDLRDRHHERLGTPVLHNLVQIALAVFTLLVVGIVLLTAKELLTSPASTIVHGWSDGSELSWYEDRVEASTPQAMVVTMPLSLWRAVWAAWVVWLAYSTIKWSKWAGVAASKGGWLRSRPPLIEDEAAEVTEAPVPAPAPEPTGGLFSEVVAEAEATQTEIVPPEAEAKEPEAKAEEPEES